MAAWLLLLARSCRMRERAASTAAMCTARAAFVFRKAEMVNTGERPNIVIANAAKQ
jgi:hypothetical protein